MVNVEFHSEKKAPQMNLEYLAEVCIFQSQIIRINRNSFGWDTNSQPSGHTIGGPVDR